MFFRLALELLKKETLNLPEIVDILGPRPFPLKETVAEYLRELRGRKVTEAEDSAAKEEVDKEKEKQRSHNAYNDAEEADAKEEDKESSDSQKK